MKKFSTSEKIFCAVRRRNKKNTHRNDGEKFQCEEKIFSTQADFEMTKKVTYAVNFSMKII